MEQPAPKPKAKPRGAPAAVQQKLARLDILAHKAMRFWEKTLDEKSDATTSEKIQVARDVVAYAWGKPRQQVQIDAKVEHNYSAHLEALNRLTLAALGPVIDAKPIETNDNSTHGTKPPLLSNDPAPIDPMANLLSAELLGLGSAAAPTGRPADDPPGSSGPPGGGLVHGQVPALDIEIDDDE